MEFILIKQTGINFKAATDEDMGKLMKLKNGNAYKFEVKQIRNIDFHRKFFALISCTWDCISDEQREFFKSKEGLRKTLQISAGHCEKVYSYSNGEFQDIPKSISFSSMDNFQFSELYNSIKNVIFEYVLNGKITEEDFNNNLINF